MAKDEEYNRLIHTTRWLRLRREVLTAHPCCQLCERRGDVRAATEVHHIHPVEEVISHAERTRRMYDPHNLMALCHDCHVRVHVEMGHSGKEATRRRNDRKLEEVIEKFF